MQVAESHWTVWWSGEQDEREQQEGWAEEQRGGGEDTCDCGSESHSIPEQSGGTGDVQPRREQSQTGEGGGGGLAAWGEGEGGARREGGGEAAARAVR